MYKCMQVCINVLHSALAYYRSYPIAMQLYLSESQENNTYRKTNKETKRIKNKQREILQYLNEWW